MSDSRFMLTGTIPLHSSEAAVAPVSFDDSASQEDFPFDVGERFEFVERLGRGGTGLVYKAFDHRLARHVAVKFLINPSPESRPHLVAEARAQANIEHPNVCRIYEVVEADEYIFLVMQYIEGPSLRVLVPSLSVEQVLIVLSKSAFALHDAHRKGIIHRDLKPDNIVVDMSDGQLEPYVVDFGLAWNIVKDGQHQGQITVGTPGFIAPELVSSHSVPRDRRGDVYSLGMSLLFCLTQEPPAYLSEHPEQIPEAVKSLPKDIAIIIQKSVTKNPAKRYTSAEAFAQDLQRYLSGEPIKARRGRVYWAKQKLIKHYRIALLVSAFVIALGAMYGKHLYAQHLQTLREEALITYNAKISALEYEAQLTYLSPAHNIEKTKAQWLGSAKEIQAQLAQAHPATLGPSYYALGRIYQLVGDESQALAHLQTAYELTPSDKVAVYLAQSYGALFSEHLQAVRNIEDKRVRESRLSDIEQEYKQPAQRLMRQSIASAPYRSYAEAQLLYYQKEWDGALSLLENSEGLPSWYYLDEVLKGDILLAKATQKYESGEGVTEVIPLIEQALASYEQAQHIAPSDPHTATKPLSAMLFSLRALNREGDAQSVDWMEGVSQRVGQAKQIDEKNSSLYLLHGQLLQFFGSNQSQHVGTSRSWFEKAETELLKGLALSQHKDDFWLSLARLYSALRKYEKENNIDASDAIQKSLDALGNVSDAGRDYYYYNELGTLNRNRAQSVKNQGGDAKPLYQAAIDAYLTANKRFPEHNGSLINAASTLRLLAESEEPEQKRAMFVKAEELLKKVLEKDASHFVANYYLSVVYINILEVSVLDEANVLNHAGHNNRAAMLAQTHRAHEAEFSRAEAQMQKLLAVNDSHPYVLNSGSRLAQLKLEHHLLSQLQWSPNIDTLIHEREKLAEASPKNPIVVSSYIGFLGIMTHTRLLLSLPAQDYIEQLAQALQAYPEFENKEVFQALLVLFRQWHQEKSELRALADELAQQYDLNAKSNYTYRNAKIVLDIARAAAPKDYDDAVKKLEALDDGITPSYKVLLLRWAYSKRPKLTH